MLKVRHKRGTSSAKREESLQSSEESQNLNVSEDETRKERSQEEGEGGHRRRKSLLSMMDLPPFFNRSSSVSFSSHAKEMKGERREEEGEEGEEEKESEKEKVMVKEEREQPRFVRVSSIALMDALDKAEPYSIRIGKWLDLLYSLFLYVFFFLFFFFFFFFFYFFFLSSLFLIKRKFLLWKKTFHLIRNLGSRVCEKTWDRSPFPNLLWNLLFILWGSFLSIDYCHWINSSFCSWSDQRCFVCSLGTELDCSRGFFFALFFFALFFFCFFFFVLFCFVLFVVCLVVWLFGYLVVLLLLFVAGRKTKQKSSKKNLAASEQNDQKSKVERKGKEERERELNSKLPIIKKWRNYFSHVKFLYRKVKRILLSCKIQETLQIRWFVFLFFFSLYRKAKN